MKYLQRPICCDSCSGVVEWRFEVFLYGGKTQYWWSCSSHKLKTERFLSNLCQADRIMTWSSQDLRPDRELYELLITPLD